MEKARSFRMQFIEPGLCSYESEGAGMVLIQKEALDRMAPTFVGMPVFNEEHIRGVPYEELVQAFTDGKIKADGVVSAVSWNTGTGWFDGDLIVWDDATAQNIESGNYFPSCAYIPGENPGDTGPGGKWHNIEYDEEIVNGKYTHLAIVPQPRYEGAKFFENSLGGNRMRLFKIGKGKEKQNAAPPAEPPKPETKPAAESKEGMENAGEEVDANSEVELPSGEKIPLSTLIEAYKAKAGPGEQANSLSPDDEVDIDGAPVKISALIEAYQAKNNAILPQDTPAELPMDESKEKQNSVPPKEKQNAATPGQDHMAIVRKAAKGGGTASFDDIETEDDRLARGRELYSLPARKGA